ncbi:MAG: hypothetical protein MR569_07865, partial [Dialister sp.]|nr:hypothetical protein [Dialister sp.]
FVIISMRKALSLFYLCTEIITFPLKGRLSSFIVSGKFPYRVKFYTKEALLLPKAPAEADMPVSASHFQGFRKYGSPISAF